MQMNREPLMKVFILSLFILNSAWALDQNEDLNTKVKAVEESQFVVLDRGREDGIRKGDHVKFYQDGNFVARGVAIHSDMQNSKFIVYRVMGTLKENGPALELLAINSSQIPDYIANKIQKLEEKLD
jgi:hypothetical protein